MLSEESFRLHPGLCFVSPLLGARTFISVWHGETRTLLLPIEVQNLVDTAQSPPLGVGNCHAWGWPNFLHPSLARESLYEVKTGRLPPISRAWSISKPSSLC